LHEDGLIKQKEIFIIAKLRTEIADKATEIEVRDGVNNDCFTANGQLTHQETETKLAGGILSSLNSLSFQTYSEGLRFRKWDQRLDPICAWTSKFGFAF
jgi:hypothetical protein